MTLAKRLAAPPQPRNSTGYVGLKNQGATCYLNSLLQVCWFDIAKVWACAGITFYKHYLSQSLHPIIDLFADCVYDPGISNGNIRCQVHGHRHR